MKQVRVLSIDMEELIEQYRTGQITKDELEEGIRVYWNRMDFGAQELKTYNRPQMLEAVLQQGKRKDVLVRKMVWWKYAAAAVFIAAMVFTGRQLINNGQESSITKTDIKPPAVNRAMITLGNGKTVYLDSAANGSLASVDNMELVKLADGKIIYKGSTQTVQYNTLTNPRGSRVIDITLSDGSRIWLNAGSSLTYPTTFTGDKRQLTIQGEGYFQVAHDDRVPFIASAKGTEVQVYGTEFNIKAYDDEADMKVTLLQGSVSVTHNLQRQMLKPSEQAIVTEKIALNKDADTDAVTTWKNGGFSFTPTQSLEEVMKQAARWYDIDVTIEPGAKAGFLVIVDRDVPISKLFEKLESSGSVHFEITGRKVTVKPGRATNK